MCQAINLTTASTYDSRLFRFPSPSQVVRKTRYQMHTAFDLTDTFPISPVTLQPTCFPCHVPRRLCARRGIRCTKPLTQTTMGSETRMME